MCCSNNIFRLMYLNICLKILPAGNNWGFFITEPIVPALGMFTPHKKMTPDEGITTINAASM